MTEKTGQGDIGAAGGRDHPGDAAGVHYWDGSGSDQRARAREVLEALRTYRAAEAAMRRRTRDSMAMGENELLAVRFLLRQPDHTSQPSVVSRYLGISTASVTAMLDKLERSGRVKRTVNSEDRRSTLITATAQANDEVRHTLGQMHDRMYAIAVDMTVEQQDAVIDFLRAMSDAVDDVSPAGEGAPA